MTSEDAGDPSVPERGGSPVQRQARALGDPTRYAIFQVVAGAPDPVGVAELTARFAINHNAVRQHLAKLCDADLLVEESAARTGPGRPRLQYRLARGVPGTWATHGPYETLALLLLEMLNEGKAAAEVGREAGRLAASFATTPGRSTLDGLLAEMQRRGFEPRAVARADDAVDVVLDFCPFAAAAGLAPEIVCEIHRGLAEGFVEHLAGDLRVTALHVRDPEQAGCHLTLKPA